MADERERFQYDHVRDPMEARKSKRYRTSKVVISRRRKVAKLICSKMTQVAIAKQLGVGTATISKDVAAIEAKWMESMLRPRSRVKARELAELDDLESDAAVSFARSRTESAPAGDVRWIKVRLDIKKRRAELLGLDEAIEINLSLLDKDVRMMTDAELEEATSLLAQVEHYGIQLH